MLCDLTHNAFFQDADLLAMNDSDFRRFMSRVVFDEATGCWLWTGAKAGGYSRFLIAGRQRPGHIVSYEHFVGPVPPGLQGDHLCRRPACVNPYDIEPVTCRVNLLRGEGVCARNARKTTCPRGHALVQVAPRRRRCVECHRPDGPDGRARIRARAAARAKEPWCPDIPGWRRG